MSVSKSRCRRAPLAILAVSLVACSTNHLQVRSPTVTAESESTTGEALPTPDLNGLGCAIIPDLATSVCPLDESSHQTAAVVSGLGGLVLVAIKRSSSFIALPRPQQAATAGSFLLFRIPSDATFGVQTSNGPFTCSVSAPELQLPQVHCLPPR